MCLLSNKNISPVQLPTASAVDCCSSIINLIAYRRRLHSIPQDFKLEDYLITNSHARGSYTYLLGRRPLIFHSKREITHLPLSSTLLLLAWQSSPFKKAKVITNHLSLSLLCLSLCPSLRIGRRVR